MASPKPNVFVSHSDVPPEAIKQLKQKCNVDWYIGSPCIPRQELLKHVKGRDGLFITVTDKINAELLDAAGPNLKCVSTTSVGFDHIDLEECRKRGVKVGHTPNLTKTVAELTVGLLLAAARRVVEADKAVRSGQWTSTLMPNNWMFGVDVAGSTIGFVGMGRIGVAVAQRLNVFEPARILYFDVRESEEANNLGGQRVDLQTVLKESDFIICNCSLNEHTKEMFNKEAFAQMKSSAIFVNTSRGGVVKQDALCAALASGRIRAAALDVMSPEPLPKDDPLTKLDNVVLMPHLGSATHECRLRMALLAVDNLMAGMTKQEMPAEIHV